jgi:hypothetical protein
MQTKGERSMVLSGWDERQVRTGVRTAAEILASTTDVSRCGTVAAALTTAGTNISVPAAHLLTISRRLNNSHKPSHPGRSKRGLTLLRNFLHPCGCLFRAGSRKRPHKHSCPGCGGQNCSTVSWPHSILLKGRTSVPRMTPGHPTQGHHVLHSILLQSGNTLFTTTLRQRSTTRVMEEKDMFTFHRWNSALSSTALPATTGFLTKGSNVTSGYR